VADAMIQANFYDLQGDPFSNTSHPAWLFASRGHQAALQALIARLKARQAFVMLLGEAGVGKTFLLRAAFAHSDLQHLKTVHVFYPKLALHDIFQMICRDFGLDEVTYDSAKMAHALHRALLTEHERGRQVVLVIDEADAIPHDVLANLLRLSHFRAFTGEPLLQMVLVGLPGLWRQFRTPPLRPFKPPRVTRVMLAPLTYGESLAYIRHRLQQAGADAGADTVFASGAVRAVAQRAGGNPRALNVLCTQMLISGFFARQRPISARMAQDVITAYGAKRSHPRWRGVTAAAILLVVGALVGLFPSTYQSVAERGPRGLLQLMRSLLTVAGVETARQPATRVSSPSVPSLVTPRQQQLGPAPQARVESTPGSAVGQDPGEGQVRLVPPESLESPRLETPPATLTPRVTPTPPAAPTPSATLTPRVPPTPPAAPIGMAVKSCDKLKAEIQAKLDAKRIAGYSLTIVANGDLKGQHIVGSCEGNTKKIVYNRSRNAQ
jgi:type II secretory pathway predicted ATPase ExeA